jgi:hypothetical protein
MRRRSRPACPPPAEDPIQPDTLGRVPDTRRAPRPWRVDRHVYADGPARLRASPVPHRQSGRSRASRVGVFVARGARRAALVLCLAAVLLLAGSPLSIVAAATPSPELVPGGDTRSEGEGAGLVGSPVLVALGVIALGVAAAGATTLYLRLTREE